MVLKLSTMEKVVELVRQNPGLYDLKSKEYRDSVWSNNCWKKIAANINEEGVTGKVFIRPWPSSLDLAYGYASGSSLVYCVGKQLIVFIGVHVELKKLHPPHEALPTCAWSFSCVFLGSCGRSDAEVKRGSCGSPDSKTHAWIRALSVTEFKIAGLSGVLRIPDPNDYI